MLQKVFPATRIKIGLESKTKDELFEELVDFYLQTGAQFADRREILKAVNEREALMSTGIKQGVAIPHGKTQAVNGISGVVGISKSGIDYDALDGQPVFLVFLLLSSKSDSELHLRALKHIAILLEEPLFLSELLAAENSHAAFQTIQKYEDILNTGV